MVYVKGRWRLPPTSLPSSSAKSLHRSRSFTGASSRSSFAIPSSCTFEALGRSRRLKFARRTVTTRSSSSPKSTTLASGEAVSFSPGETRRVRPMPDTTAGPRFPSKGCSNVSHTFVTTRVRRSEFVSSESSIGYPRERERWSLQYQISCAFWRAQSRYVILKPEHI